MSDGHAVSGELGKCDFPIDAARFLRRFCDLSASRELGMLVRLLFALHD